MINKFSDEIIKQIKAENTSTELFAIEYLIKEHATEAARLKRLWNRYIQSAKGLPIKNRRFADLTKINNKIANDFPEDIIRTKSGYFMGIPVVYALEDAGENEAQAIEHFIRKNYIQKLDNLTSKKASICGKAYRLLYIDQDGEVAVNEIDPWEVVLIMDQTISDTPTAALRYFPITEITKDNATGDTREEKRYKAEWYTETKVKIFLQGKDGKFRLADERPHMVGGLPVIEYKNNAETSGDFENVIDLIDGADKTLSDVNSELESVRMWYQYLFGAEMTEKEYEKAKRTGMFNHPDHDVKTGFLSKDMNDTVIENHLNRIEKNIYRFSGTPDMESEGFYTALSGVAMKFRLFKLEAKCSETEIFFKEANTRMWKLISKTFGIQRTAIFDYLDITQSFTRRYPKNVKEESEILEKLWGRYPRKRIWELMSFCDDPDQIEEEMKEEEGGIEEIKNELARIREEENQEFSEENE